MKKTSLIILTLVASLTISLNSASGNPSENIYPPDYLIDAEMTPTDTVRYDTLRRDSLQYYQQQQPVVTYNYYYRSRFFDNLFRICRPRRYYAIINQPGYVPRHVRSETRASRTQSHDHHMVASRPAGHRSGRSSRGGFGHSGSHSQSN